MRASKNVAPVCNEITMISLTVIWVTQGFAQKRLEDTWRTFIEKDDAFFYLVCQIFTTTSLWCFGLSLSLECFSNFHIPIRRQEGEGVLREKTPAEIESMRLGKGLTVFAEG